MAVRTILEIHVYANGKVSLNILNYCLLLCMHVIFNSLVLLICMSLNAIKIASRFFGAQPLAFQNDSSFLSLIVSQGLA